MKAAEVHPPFGIEHVRIVERREPAAPGPGQVLVRVRAVSLNHRDLLVVQGFDRWRPPAGRIPCSDAMGEVVAVGPGVERWKVGGRVISTILPRWIDGPLTPHKLEGSLGGAAADGVLAQYVLLDAESVVRAPGCMSDMEVATLPCAALTAWHALVRAGSLRSGATVLVQGTGGVSLFALQFAAAAGARVIATSSSDEKLARATALGAHHTINYRTHSAWDEVARRLTDGEGVDQVIDVGGADTLARSISAVRFEGIVSAVGLVGGLKAVIDLAPVFNKNVRIDGVETGSRRMFEDMVKWITDRSIRPVIDRTFPLEEVRAALKHLHEAHHVGKVGITL